MKRYTLLSLQNETMSDIIILGDSMKYSESKNVELKRKFTNNIFKTISAFSNDEGGKIIIGVDDSGTIVGVCDLNNLRLKIENQINDSIKPRPLFELKVKNIDDLDTLEIYVYQGETKPYYYNNVAYTRNDTSTVPIDNINLTQMILDGQNLSFDQMKSIREDLTFKYVQKKFKEELKIEILSEGNLVSLGLIKEGRYNYGAELLSDNGSFIQSFIDIAKFRLDIDTFEDRIRLRNESILKYYDDSLEVFNKYYSINEVVGASTRTKVEPIPFIAYKEALVNAILHRDYLLKNGIQIAMFDNRIEIRSPGNLPKGITPEMYFEGMTSIPRNPVISFIFFRLGIIEQFGTGINRIINSYRDTGTRPHFSINKNQLKIILPVINYDYTKLKDVEAIDAFLSAQPESSRKEIEDALSIDKTTIIRRLNELIELGRIIKIGNGPSTKYSKKGV